MGRPRKPTRLKLLHGVDKVNPERINRAEPQPPLISEMSPPKNLDTVAKVKWKELLGHLVTMRIATTADREALTLAAMTWSKMVSLEKLIAKTGGVLIEGQRGRLIRNPASIDLCTWTAQYVKLLVEFGMTPAARSRVSVVAGGSASDPFEELKRRRG